MTARRKHKSTGPLANSGTAKAKRDPPCPSARCRCGHLRKVHETSFGPALACFAGDPMNDPRCSCKGFVLAKPKKPAAKKPATSSPCARCGHKRNWHTRYKVLGRCTPPFKGARTHRACTCDEFVSSKPAAKKKWGPCPLPPHRDRAVETARAEVADAERTLLAAFTGTLERPAIEPFNLMKMERHRTDVLRARQALRDALKRSKP